MRILVTGATGQLGSDLCVELVKRGHTVIGLGSANMDITDREAVWHTLEENRPDAVIHCAAWTNVDGAESEENRDKVFEVNFNGTENIALACKKLGCKMLYISTDYVFNGLGEKPWEPDCMDFGPQNVYGESKLQGELAAKKYVDKLFIVRIAWVFGENGRNFVSTMLKLSETHSELRIVNDQIGTPTYTPDLSVLLADMIVTDKYGVYHATNEGGYISWADFAEEIFARTGKNTKVIPVTTEEYGASIAVRPFNSRLDKSKLASCGFIPLPDWRDALSRYLCQLGY